MRPFLRTLPAVLAILLLGAHFFRAGFHVLVAACLALVPVLIVPRPRVRAFSRICLAAGAVEWLFTAWRIARFRIAAGEPYLRMLAILVTAAAFTVVAAWTLPSGSGRSRNPNHRSSSARRYSAFGSKS